MASNFTRRKDAKLGQALMDINCPESVIDKSLVQIVLAIAIPVCRISEQLKRNYIFVVL
jgi:hypothetical protein